MIGQLLFILVNYGITLGLMYCIGYLVAMRRTGRRLRKNVFDYIDQERAAGKDPDPEQFIDRLFNVYLKDDADRPWLIQQADKLYDYLQARKAAKITREKINDLKP